MGREGERKREERRGGFPFTFSPQPDPQESRIKHFKQQLEHVVGEFYSVSEAIDPAVRPLLRPHLEAVTRYVEGRGKGKGREGRP